MHGLTWRGDGGFQARTEMPREHQKTEEGADCGRRGFPAKTVFRRRLLADKVGEVLGIHAFPIDRVGTKMRGQEGPWGMR